MNKEFLSIKNKNVTLQNILFQNEFSVLQNQCLLQNIPLIPIKGISFFNRIYNSSERTLTDIDVYTPLSSLARLREILSSEGYVERQEDKWSATLHKVIFTKYRFDLEITLEVHTQLLANKCVDSWNFIFDNSKHPLLAPMDEILYLSYHYAEQHTLLHPKWLHDIYLLTHKSPFLWTKQLWIQATEKHLCSSLVFTAVALNTKYKMNIEIPKTLKSFLAQFLVTTTFIENPNHYRWKYFLIKHLTKDSLFSALHYDLGWVIFFAQQRIKKNMQRLK